MKKTEKMQLKLNFDTSVVVLPATVANFLDKAKKFDLKVLFLVAAKESFREKNYAKKIADELNCEVSDVENSISFWNGTGIISVGAEEENKIVKDKEVVEKAPKTPTPARAKVSFLNTRPKSSTHSSRAIKTLWHLLMNARTSLARYSQRPI